MQTEATPKPLVLRREDAARYVGLSVASLDRSRVSGWGPPATVLAPRIIGYRVSDLDRWVDERAAETSREGRAD